MNKLHRFLIIWGNVHVCMCAAAAKSLQLYPTLCDPIDSSPPGSPAPGILQARTLEWVAISFSNAWKWKVKGKSLSCVWFFATPWTAAHQTPLSVGCFQARVLEWGAIAFSGECVLNHFSFVQLYNPWTVGCQGPLSVGFSKHEYWSALLCPPPEDHPHPGIEPVSLMSPALAEGAVFCLPRIFPD